ncbi:MAG: HEAT repeat domain-containing protein [Candidatus Melainabacteria bacterium]
MTLVHINRVERRDPRTGELQVQYVLPAVAIQTPTGKKRVPNPAGREVCVYATLAEAEDAARMAGFDYEFEGQTTSTLGQMPPGAVAITPGTGNPFRQAMPLLIQRLKDREASVVAHAATALGEVGWHLANTPGSETANMDAVMALIAILGHEDGGIRKAVAEALAKQGVPAMQQLAAAWQKARTSPHKDAPYIRLTVLTAYLEMMTYHPQLTAGLLPEAIAGLQDDSWLVRAQAAQVITRAAEITRPE